MLSQYCVYVVDGYMAMLAVVHKRRYTNVLSSEWGGGVYAWQ